jgi:hypothetical protein
VIYQLYNHEDQLRNCWNDTVYRPFPMSPRVNADLVTVLPEVAEPGVEAQAREAAGFLAVARLVKRDRHPWVGFTSWRQVAKGIAFKFQSTHEIEDRLKIAPALSWNIMGNSEAVWTQGERCHPGLMEYFERLHARSPKILTAAGLAIYRSRAMRHFPWASYVLFSWELFHEFIQDITPEWEYMVNNYKADPYLTVMTFAPQAHFGSHIGNSTGGLSAAWSAFFERYIGVWLLQRGLRLFGLRNIGRHGWEGGEWKFADEMLP